MADRDTDELNIDNVIKKLLKGKLIFRLTDSKYRCFLHIQSVLLYMCTKVCE